MKQCAYCLEYKVEENSNLRPEPKTKLLFPSGQKIPFYMVCFDCNRVRLAWQKEIDAKKFAERERKRLWHKEVEERREQKRLMDAATAVQRALRQRESDMAKMANLEAQIAICTASLEALRKKYLSETDKST